MRARPGSVVSLAVMLAAGRAHALDPDRPLARRTMQRWGEGDGLPQPRVRAIAEDGDGYLWLGTDGGLVRFDGVRFDLWTPEDTGRALGTRVIRTLLHDARGRLWIGTHGEGALALREEGTFRSLRGAADARGSAIVAALAGRDGVLWFASWSGVMRLAGEAWSSVGPEHGLPSAPVFALAEDDAGALWLGTWAGLARWRDGRGARVALPGVRADLPVRALAWQGGRLWVGSFGDGLYEVALDAHGEPARVVHHGGDSGLPHPAIETLLPGRDGSLWIGTRGGLARLWRGAIELPARAASALRSPIEALHEDRDGRLWVGSATEGLVAITSGPIFALTEADGLPRQPVTAVAASRDGTLWVGTRGDGVVRVRGEEVTRVAQGEPACTTSVATLLAEDDGALWIGGTGGRHGNLCRLLGGRAVSFGPAQGLPLGDAVRALLRDRRGALRVGGTGLHRLEGERFLREPLPGEPLDRPWNVFAVQEARDGALLVATSAGLFRGDGAGWSRITGWFVASALERPGGELWLGTIQGLVRRRPDATWQWGRELGLPEQPVHGVVDDALGNLWIASPSGLSRLTPTAAGARVRRFDLADGLPTTQLTEAESSSAALRAPDGRILLATGKGLAIVDPAGVPPEPAAPRAIVEAIRVRHHARPLRAPVRLSPGERDLEIAFTAPAPGRAHRLRFRYRLVPFDADWVEAGARRLAIYTALPRGRFRFEAQALDEAGRPGPPSRELLFELLPAWHERAAVRGAGLVALALLGLALHRARLRRAEARQRAVAAERGRIARELHDSLAQKLTGISLHLEAVRHRLDSAPERARASLDQARALTRVGLAEARAVVWDLAPEALRRTGLSGALAELVGQMSAEVPVRLQVDGDRTGLAADAETALLRVAQEGVANALRHARPGQVVVTLACAENAVELTVRDDGAGFDPAAVPAGRGLSGLRERVAAHGGTLEWTSAPGQGSALRARIPCPTGAPR